MVSPEQIVLIPRIGEFSTKGKTLEELKAEVKNKATQVFKSSRDLASVSDNPVSLTLMQPRKILVKVRGEVTTPSVYSLTAATRADVAVDLANKAVQPVNLINDESHMRELEMKQRESDRLRPYFGKTDRLASERNIIVTHADGTSERVDLVRYNATHDPRFSPLLREGDVIQVPFRKPLEGMVGVYNAVEAPGDFEFIEGDSLYAMIQAAFGPTPNADLTRVELTRLSDGSDDFTTQTIDALAIKNGQAPDVPLRRGDRIIVRGRIDTREIARVIVKGEVKNPGVYPITRTQTKLSDVIEMAGGFTAHAFLKGGRVTRHLRDADHMDITQEEEALQVARLSNLDVFDTANFHMQTRIRDANVSVDMDRLFSKGDHSADVTLRDEDIVTIPSISDNVYVWGYVGSNGFIAYQQGRPVDYYINAAGGYAEGAVKSRTRVIKAKSRKWMRPDETEIEPGDEIYVFKEPDKPDDYNLRTIGAIAGIVAAVVSTVVTIIYVTRTN
jgi:protein involved in polysaccharide export with SLBB domain